MKQPVINTSGKKIGQVELPAKIFTVKTSQQLLAQAITSYLANQRQATAKVKTRGEVVGSRKKIWRQKGTGRARHGDKYAPIFVGGGIAHGPTGVQNYKRQLTKKMKRLSLFAALTDKLNQKQIIIVSGLDSLEPKTKNFAAALKSITNYPQNSPILLVMPRSINQIIRGTNNLPLVTLTQATRLNTYEVFIHPIIIFMKESLEILSNHFLSSPAKPTAPSPAKSSTKTKSSKS